MSDIVTVLLYVSYVEYESYPQMFTVTTTVKSVETLHSEIWNVKFTSLTIW